MKRVPIPELLDTDAGSPSEVAACLADLRWFNRWFGGVTTSAALVEGVARQAGARSLSMLEVACGAGYVPATVAAQLRPRGIKVEVALLDRALSHINGGSRNGMPAVVGNAVALPFSDNSFDLVSSNLFTHHLSPQELLQFVKEGLRVCRTAVIINDLVRHPLHLAVVYAGLPLYRSRITRHDAPASVRQAYTEGEMGKILSQMSATRVEFMRGFLYRMGVTVWK